MGHRRYSGNHPRFSKHHMVNSWEEEDVKRGRKEMAEGHKGHAEALFDDAHGSYNWHPGMDTHAEHHSSPASMRDESGKTHQEMRGMQLDNHMRKNHMSPEDFLNKTQEFKESQRDMKMNQDKETPDTPVYRHTDKHMKREARRIARRTEGDEQDIYYEMLKKSKEPKRGEAGFQQDPQEAYYENMSDRSGLIEHIEKVGVPQLRDADGNIVPASPLPACAIDEGGSGCIKKMGGSWRVISNKTDKPWPAKYGSESKAKAALRGYHAG